VGPAVDRAIEEGMLPMLEMHDSTCKWALDPIVNYWTSKEAVDFIKKREGNFLLNIANEADTDDDAQFVNDYKAAIKKIRDAGIRVPIVIDGSGCGRDYPGLFAAAPALLASDPMGNVIFSAHWYDPTSTAAVTKAFQDANDLQINFIVGEFANKSPPGCGPAVPYLQLIREADKYDIGWLAWSWGDDEESSWWNADCSEFDMTRTFEASTLERWGLEVAKTDMASIEKTASRTKWLADGTCN
jgi:mannan endo-1,4-beta-mannosidase